MAYKIPESVLVVVYTRQLEVLLLQRADGGSWGSWGAWQSVTGSREPGEPALETQAPRGPLGETVLSVVTLPDGGHVNRYEIGPPWRAKYAAGVTHNTEHVFGFLVDSAT